MRSIRPYLTSPWLMVSALLLMALAMHVGWFSPDHALIGAVALNTAAFAVNPELTAIAIGFQNAEDSLIADEVMPRVDTAETFKWTEYDTAEAYTVPDARVGRKSEPTQVTFSGTDHESSVEDFGFDDFVPQRDMDVWGKMPKPASGAGPISPEARATMMLTNLVLLAREVRVAGTVFNAANYDAALQDTLSGTDQWSDYANSDPISDILLALDEPLVRPNVFVLSQPVWTMLRMHPKALAAVYHNDMKAGTVTRQQLQEVLEVDRILVGASRVNMARKGQAANLQRTWGKHAALIHVSKTAAELAQPVWGWTAQFGGRFAGTIPEPKRGLKGGNTVRSGEQVKEVVSAKGAGYFFQNVIA